MMHRLSCTQLVTTCMSLAELSALSFSMRMEAPRVCFIRQIGTSTGRGRYYFKNPITFRAGDTLWMGCTWDNSASNQPIIDGVAKEPVDVAWGEGTSDEMCLGGFYATAE